MPCGSRRADGCGRRYTGCGQALYKTYGQTMIKRVVGAVFALCVLAVIVFTVLGHGSYSSLVAADGAAPAERAAASKAEQPAEDGI